MDSKALWLTPNTTVVYYMSWSTPENGRLWLKPRPQYSPASWTTLVSATSAISATPVRTGARAQVVFLPPGYKGALLMVL